MPLAEMCPELCLKFHHQRSDPSLLESTAVLRGPELAGIRTAMSAQARDGVQHQGGKGRRGQLSPRALRV